MKAAQKMLRNSIGIEILKEYYKMAKATVNEKEYLLLEEQSVYEPNRNK